MSSTKKKIGYAIFVLLLIFVVVSVFYRLPYYVMMPGDTHDLDPVIKVKGGNHYKEGDFLFMTVKIIRPNIYQYAYAKLRKYYTIFPVSQFRNPGENQNEYRERQLYYMQSAEWAATYVAYEKANKQPKLAPNGVAVLAFRAGMPAEKKLQLGDIIVDVEEKKVKKVQDLLDLLKGKTKGDLVKLTVLRDGGQKEVIVPIGEFSKQEIAVQRKHGVKDPNLYGLGISPVQSVKLEVNPSITFHTGQIGGPSGGLMFSLDIYNQLTEENWTKGYKVAGTGTIIDKKGEVGPIGGIEDKVIAADADDVEVFFAPTADNNYKDAVVTAKDIGTSMEIVPVDNFNDALHYLKKLTPKK